MNEQDIRINWFKIVFSEPIFDIAARLLEKGAAPFPSDELGIYSLPPSDSNEDFVHHQVVLNGKETVEVNDNSHPNNPFTRKSVNINTNRFLTAKLISIGIQEILKKNRYTVSTMFANIGTYDPEHDYQFNEYLHGTRIFTVDPFYLHTQSSFGVRVNTYFKLHFSKTFSDSFIARVFINDPVVFRLDDREYKGHVIRISDSIAIIKGVDGTDRTVDINHLFPVASLDTLSAHHNDLNLPHDFMRQVLLYSHSINSFNKDNTFIYADVLRDIEGFLERNKHSFMRVKLPVISPTHFSIDTNLLSTEYITLPPRMYEFGEGGQNRDVSQYKGIQKFGAIKPSRTNTPFFIVVFQESDKDLANKLYLSLKNGIGYFPGIKKFFNIELNKEDLLGVRIDLSGIAVTDYSRIAEKYSTAIIEKIPDLPTNREIFAFLIIPKTPDYIDPSPYYSCKALLTCKGIHSQAVDRSLLINEESFKWAIANIALATFTKLGGYPWRVSSSRKTDLIMGVGRSDIYDPQRKFASRVVGYTICFSPDGTFRSFHATPPTAQSDYLSGLKSAVEHSLKLQIQKDPSIKRIIIHFPKHSGRKDINAIEQGIRTIFADTILPYIVLRIIPESDFQGFDMSHNSRTPLEGTYVHLSNRDALIWLEGRPHNRTISKKPSNPIRITLEKTNIPKSQIDFNSLVMDVYNLAGANWRGFNAKAKPITTYYSKLIAELMYHMYRQSSDLKDSSFPVDSESPWFL